jgi:Uri superfamily endonuclease
MAFLLNMNVKRNFLFLLRVSAHHWHVSAFLCNRKFLGIRYYTKNRHTVSSVTASHLHEASGIRTPDNLIKSQVLYRLS